MANNGKLTVLKKPLKRRLQTRSLVLRVSETGIALKGYRRQRWHLVTWERLASLVGDTELEVLVRRDAQIGEAVLDELGAGKTKPKESKNGK